MFVVWQARSTREPLLPLGLFRDRNFSLANVAITTLGLRVTAMAFPTDALRAGRARAVARPRPALLLVPMAVISACLSPYVGRLTDRAHPRWIAGVRPRVLRSSACSGWPRSWAPTTPIWVLLLPIALIGVGNGFMWAPIGTVGDPQPADEPGGRRRGRLQHHAPDRRGARQRRASPC